LVTALVGAELQLALAVVEIDIADGMSNVFAPIADLCPLKGRPSTLRKANI
jgi:hypothetical protein